MNVEVAVQYAAPRRGVPAPVSFRRWAGAALAGRRRGAALVVRIVGEVEIASLNRRFRACRGTTNVLSFPFAAPIPQPRELLGDVVICAPVVRREAREQGKPARAHWAHMTVHGVLHLLGYDHTAEEPARVMEGLEAKILGALGYPDPYGGCDVHER
jgi:probable rRNA maturation factor